jgi:hypothetical protein
MDRNYIVELIKSNRLQEAIKAIENATQGTHLHNQVISISAAFAEYTRMNRSATEDFQTLDIQRAKITNNLLSVLDEVEPEALKDKRPTATTTTSSTTPFGGINKMYLYIGGGVLGLLLLMFIFGGGGDEGDISATGANNTEITNAQQNAGTDLTAGVNFVDYKIDGNKIGHFMQQNETTWVEVAEGDKYQYKETQRVDDFIYLRDDKNKTTVTLDLHDKVIHIKEDKDSAPHSTFPITNFGQH